MSEQRDPADDKPCDPIAGEGTDAERGTWGVTLFRAGIVNVYGRIVR